MQNLQEGEASVSQELLDFLLILIAGSSQKRKKNSKCIRQVQSYSKNIVYAVHNEKIKMSRHIMLRMSLKSLRNSQKLLILFLAMAIGLVYRS